jgi:hypothetical protein
MVAWLPPIGLGLGHARPWRTTPRVSGGSRVKDGFSADSARNATPAKPKSRRKFPELPRLGSITQRAKRARHRARRENERAQLLGCALKLPRLGSNRDSSDPERRPQGAETRQLVTPTASSCRPLPGFRSNTSINHDILPAQMSDLPRLRVRAVGQHDDRETIFRGAVNNVAVLRQAHSPMQLFSRPLRL